MCRSAIKGTYTPKSQTFTIVNTSKVNHATCPKVYIYSCYYRRLSSRAESWMASASLT